MRGIQGIDPTGKKDDTRTMKTSRGLCLAVLACYLTATSCTTLREIPRGQYALAADRKAVRVTTREGLQYEFDYATFDADSMQGFRHRQDVEGPLDQVATVHFALDDIAHLESRGVDWYRTSLVGGGILAGVLAVGLTAAARNSNNGGGSSGGPKGISMPSFVSRGGAGH
jgi:hypothetical protein